LGLLSRQMWLQFWQIVRPYWISQSFQGTIQILLLVFFSLGSSAFIIFEILQRGEITSSLAAQDLSRFQQAIWIFCSLIIVNIICVSGKNYIQAQISLNWRKWLTLKYLNQYSQQQSFYHLHNLSEIDNPDQRIAEDIKNVSQKLIALVVILLDSSVQLIGFLGVLWLISPLLMIVLISYAIAGTFLATLVFGKVLVGINLEQIKREADFRYGLTRIRDNAESIAFYEGQSQESEQSKGRFKEVFSNINRLIRWQFNLNIFQNGYQYLTFILPFIILAPRIFSRELEIGAITQSQAAFERVGLALGLIITQFEQLSVLTVGIKRLVELTNGIEKVIVAQNNSQIEFITQPHIVLNHLTLQRPQEQSILIQDLSIKVLPNQSLIIVGVSGVGKTTLLRAIAGLWVDGKGIIERPDLKEMLFLPQRPYMTLGTLRQQLIYPDGGVSPTTESLLNILEKVYLPDLAQRHRGLDIILDWSRILSLGEQQRLAFARLFINQPKYAILDEATSALDEETAINLYKKLQATKITYISVAHRPELFDYHQFVLELRSPEWQFLRNPQIR
jgi:ABC-type uncharacterized transport system fused permease/ATPase subunit